MKRSLAAAAVGPVIIATAAFAWSGSALWPFGGQDLQNTRHASAGVKISPANVADLAVRWVFQTGADVSATPSVDGTSVYVPDWAGNVYSLDRQTGAVNWSFQVAAHTGNPGDFSRATPAIHGNMVIFGNQGGRSFGGAELIAVNRNTGALVWSTAVDDHPAAIVTQSAIVSDEIVYVGVASVEELFAGVIPGYPCCTFRGSLVALDVNTGEILWKTYMAPEGYSGNAVWGPTASIDPSRGSIFVATGNNYSVPDDDLACVAANEGDPDAVAACLPPDNHFDAVVALDMFTGDVKWATRALSFDAWTVACLFGDEGPNPSGCSSPSGPDLDFGEGPALFSINNGRRPLDVVGAGQKSGQYWVFDRETGEVVWVTQAGPGGVMGGMIWGSATDGDRVYVAEANSFSQPHTLLDGTTVCGGFWTAMAAQTGEILWQTAVPGQVGCPAPGPAALGPTTVANGVVYACSLDAQGNMYAMDAATGEVLWSFASGGSCNAGAAIVDGAVYWGSGYGSAGLELLFPYVTGNNKLYAFEPVD